MSENLTTYTESGDSGGYMSETATTVTVAAVPCNVSSYLYKDFGAAYFTNGLK